MMIPTIDAGVLDSGPPESAHPPVRMCADEPCTCQSGAQRRLQCSDDGELSWCACELDVDAFSAMISGSWLGTRSTPWDGSKRVRLRLTEDGAYAAEAEDAGAVSFYWGTDEESEDKRWRIDTVNSRREGFGRLSIVFATSSIQEGELSRVQLSDDADQLRFEFWNTWDGRRGPVRFELARVQGDVSSD